MKKTWCKLTDAQGRTLCGYAEPLLAVLHDPIHGNYLAKPSTQLWRCESEERETDGMRCRAMCCTIVEQVPTPPVTVEQRVRYAILVALTVAPAYNRRTWADSFRSWAEKWLDGAERSEAAARAAAEVAWEATAVTKAQPPEVVWFQEEEILEVKEIPDWSAEDEKAWRAAKDSAEMAAARACARSAEAAAARVMWAPATRASARAARAAARAASEAVQATQQVGSTLDLLAIAREAVR